MTFKICLQVLHFYSAAQEDKLSTSNEQLTEVNSGLDAPVSPIALESIKLLINEPLYSSSPQPEKFCLSLSC